MGSWENSRNRGIDSLLVRMEEEDERERDLRDRRVLNPQLVAAITARRQNERIREQRAKAGEARLRRVRSRRRQL